MHSFETSIVSRRIPAGASASNRVGKFVKALVPNFVPFRGEWKLWNHFPAWNDCCAAIFWTRNIVEEYFTANTREHYGYKTEGVFCLFESDIFLTIDRFNRKQGSCKSCTILSLEYRREISSRGFLSSISPPSYRGIRVSRLDSCQIDASRKQRWPRWNKSRTNFPFPLSLSLRALVYRVYRFNGASSKSNYRQLLRYVHQTPLKGNEEEAYWQLLEKIRIV